MELVLQVGCVSQAEGDEGTAVFRHQGSKGREDLNPDSPVRADILLRRLWLRKGSALALSCTGPISPLDGTPISTQRRRAACLSPWTRRGNACPRAFSAGGRGAVLQRVRGEVDGRVQRGEEQGAHEEAGRRFRDLPRREDDRRVSTGRRVGRASPSGRECPLRSSLSSIVKDYGCVSCRRRPQQSSVTTVVQSHKWGVGYAPAPSDIIWSVLTLPELPF